MTEDRSKPPRDYRVAHKPSTDTWYAVIDEVGVEIESEAVAICWAHRDRVVRESQMTPKDSLTPVERAQFQRGWGSADYNIQSWLREDPIGAIPQITFDLLAARDREQQAEGIEMAIAVMDSAGPGEVATDDAVDSLRLLAEKLRRGE